MSPLNDILRRLKNVEAARLPKTKYIIIHRYPIWGTREEQTEYAIGERILSGYEDVPVPEPHRREQTGWEHYSYVFDEPTYQAWTESLPEHYTVIVIRFGSVESERYKRTRNETSRT